MLTLLILLFQSKLRGLVRWIFAVALFCPSRRDKKGRALVSLVPTGNWHWCVILANCYICGLAPTSDKVLLFFQCLLGISKMEGKFYVNAFLYAHTFEEKKVRNVILIFSPRCYFLFLGYGQCLLERL